MHHETTIMKIIKTFFCYFLSVFVLCLGNGCATLPNVSKIIDETPTDREPRQIVSSKGLLSPQKSKAIMERLKRAMHALALPDWQRSFPCAVPHRPPSRYLPTPGFCWPNTLRSKPNWKKINSEYRSIWNPERNTVPCTSTCTVFLIIPLTVSGMRSRRRTNGVISTRCSSI